MATTENSILVDVKKLIGPYEDYTVFDPDIIMGINMCFSILTQMGVGPETGFKITGETETWTDFIADMSKIEMLKEYIALKVGLIFDPPVSNLVKESKEAYIKELEYRLYVQFDKEGGFVNGQS